MFVLVGMAAMVKKAAEQGVNLAEILFWRQLPTIPVLLAWFALRGRIKALKTTRAKAHAGRAVTGIMGMLGTFGAVTLLPLAEATTLNFTVVFWAVILSSLLLGEKVGKWRWLAVIAGFAGVLLIVQPGSGQIPLFGALVALFGAFMVAIISIQIRDLGKTEEPLVVVFYFALFSTPLLALALPFVAAPHPLESWLLLGAIAAGGLLGQFLLTASLRYGTVSSVIVMDYSALLWATLLGWQLFGQLPPAAIWLGAPLIIGAGIIIAWREHRKSSVPTTRRAYGTGT